MTSPLRTPVMFIHGLWLHSTSWQGWADRFREAGYEPMTPEWPGAPASVAEARRHPERQAGNGLAEISRHHARIIRDLGSKPVLVGHSVGGFIAQHLLGQGLGTAAVAICPGQIRGVKAVGPAQAKSTFAFLKNPANTRCRLAGRGPVPLRVRQRRLPRGVRPALRGVDRPQPGTAALPTGPRQLRPAFAREGRHPQQQPRAAPAAVGQARSHRPRRPDTLHVQAVPPLRRHHGVQEVRRPRALPDRRQRLAPRGRHRPHLAHRERAHLTPHHFSRHEAPTARGDHGNRPVGRPPAKE
ncbi:esterase/lipase family protein [Streptomyces netropsis]|uniref:Pimeloyl-ACP methyl ester carboxylesterase n=1 Tax=Streptomyces netropsis TaxID=55404 RepID=A0A7W7LIC9_STRNE|nr:alpha/beta hydrolase [Streptomyces netropsis]MBB4890739.1 pimeloyl-ACP methyl ester carboxylesterase [Streptomyces netropsis]